MKAKPSTKAGATTRRGSQFSKEFFMTHGASTCQRPFKQKGGSTRRPRIKKADHALENQPAGRGAATQPLPGRPTHHQYSTCAPTVVALLRPPAPKVAALAAPAAVFQLKRLRYTRNSGRVQNLLSGEKATARVPLFRCWVA